MSTKSLPLGGAAALGVLAIVPTWYGLGEPGTAGVLSAFNGAIIFAALYAVMARIDGFDHHPGASA